MTRESLITALAALEHRLDTRIVIVREILNPDGTVDARIIQTRDPRSSHSETKLPKERP